MNELFYISEAIKKAKETLDSPEYFQKMQEERLRSIEDGIERAHDETLNVLAKQLLHRDAKSADRDRFTLIHNEGHPFESVLFDGVKVGSIFRRSYGFEFIPCNN